MKIKNTLCDLRACLKIKSGPAAADFGRGQGGELRASPQRAVSNEPTPATAKRRAARRVFAQKAAWLRCSLLTDPPGVCSFVAPRHPAFCAKTGPLLIFKQALTVAVVLKLGTLVGSAQAGVVFTSLYSFSGGTNGGNPEAALVQGSDGNFYGTTLYGGTASGVSIPGPGTVFKISTNGVLTSLYSFYGGFNSANPQAGLVQGSDGNFYGTTYNAGAYTNQYGRGDGNFYGTAYSGGTNNVGTVFRLTIEPQLSITVSGTFITLSWPTNYAGWYLQRTVNLGAAGFVRITLQQPPIIVNGQFVVALPITSDQQVCYRLSSQ